ncbi:PREDICTED: protein Largen [Miniopterus natalensis]|uniref:protein Largen n=1 Tax=Miniopterus natalensis TaxID=291302 RepID=UPI0007A70FCD|nr:PREDICTED: protein Largen [Miniopterus natalensis]
MSSKSKGTPSSSSPAEGPPAASKTKVKEQIKIIVEDLELVLGDLKDVAKELKEVVDQIDTLTSDLQLEDEMTDSSKTDTLNSSSSGTTASSLEKLKVQAGAPPLQPAAHPPAVLTVLRKPNPPPPPPRLTPVKREDPPRAAPAGHPAKTNGTLLRNGGFPGAPSKIPNGDACCAPGGLHRPPSPLENGGLGISHSTSFPPLRPATVPPPTAPKPQKTILRKSTTTTV